MSKEFLRKKLIIFRKNNFIDKDITFIKFQRLLKKFNLKKKINIGGYYPINSEINSLNILEKLERNNFKISLPVIKNQNTMDFYEWSFKDILRVSSRGIPEPVANKKVIPDVLIVPMVGFDKHKFRLGYGGGFYDRYIYKILKLKKIITIGCAFSFQEIKKIPTNKFDQKLNYILTNKNDIK